MLKEAASPAGYTLPAHPYTGVVVRTGQTSASDDVEIINTQQRVPLPPMTGADGQIVLVALGIGASDVAVGLLLVNHRRERAAI